MPFYTAEDNRLDVNNGWAGRIFVNPPTGLVNEFWTRLVREVVHPDGGVFCGHQAIWIGYSLEQLQTLQRIGGGLFAHPLQFPMCIPSSRLAFTENAAKRELRLAWLRDAGATPNASSHAREIARRIAAGTSPKGSPSHGNYITYIGPRVSEFLDVFSQFGVVRR